MISVPAGTRDTLVELQRPAPDDSFRGAGSGSWSTVDTEWVELRDLLPSRGEASGDGMPTATRRARVRMDWRADITADMRLVADDRIMQIVSGPAELGRRAGLEMIVEDYSGPGNPA